MSASFILICIALYFGGLLLIAYITGRKSDANSYFIGNKASPWYAVAFGMLGDSLSGVTYISVPGNVVHTQFSYLQLVLGYLVGYAIIAKVLLPLYYKMNLLSIYTYLENRFGRNTQKTGAFFFILSRTLGAAGRLYLAAGVIQFFVFDRLESIHIPFAVSVSVIIALMLLYTYKGGIKTLVWTDTFQSFFLLMGVVLSIAAIISSTNWSLAATVSKLVQSPHTKIFFFNWHESSFFFKQFLGGVFIAVTMTGLDQNMMQKNLSCRSLQEAQKNIYWFSIVVVVVNFFFLALGALLFLYQQEKNIALPVNEAGKIITDRVFPNLALNHLGIFAGLVFIIGLTAATFSSADSVLTTLTTSMYVDMLELDKKTTLPETQKTRYRHIIHISFAVLLWLCIIVFNQINNQAIIDTILLIAGYTYGPLLGLFSFGIFLKKQVPDGAIPFICVASPLLTYALSLALPKVIEGYQTGNEIILLNGFITFAGLYLAGSKKQTSL
ncbi:MAG: sodium:solute symporter [Bacteroidetes bacterium]|nr:sodium:solute symporter [Bacteroidota bacterium]